MMKGDLSVVLKSRGYSPKFEGQVERGKENGVWRVHMFPRKAM